MSDMNPVKAHILDRLRPKDRTMTTMTDEEAFALGVRAVEAGLRPKVGMLALANPVVPAQLRYPGVVVRAGNGNTVTTSRDHTADFHPDEFAPDLRDPGTKGHAVAQLRERTGNPLLAVHWLASTGNVPEGWYAPTHAEWPPEPLPVHPTEEEAIVAAFEATKETP